MTNYRRISLLGLALVAALALTACQAKEAAQKQQQQQQQASIASKILPQTRSRTARSLSDMFEKVKSKIFGSKKQAAASAVAPASGSGSAIQPAASAVAPSVQRQPWEQQYNPYYPLMASTNYQWPVSSSNQQQQFANNQLNGFGSQPASSGQQSIYPSSLGFDASNQVGNVQPLSSSVKSGSASPSGGLFSSASQLFAQYMSPNSALGQQSSAQPVQSNQISGQQQQQQGSAMGPQQQSQYNEFASVLDSLVAQTGPSSPIRQPNQPQQQQQYQSMPDMSLAGPQQQQQQFGQQQFGQQLSGQQPNSMLVGDQDMSASSNVGSYLPSAPSGAVAPQQASQKSGGSGSQMIGLAEQLAPGAQFNKLISFPFSLSNNDDPAKEGRFKLHIPFLNQHVKRSDQQQTAAKSAAAAAAQTQQQQQQQQQQYLAQQQQYFNQQQQQQYLSSQQQLQALPSQVVPVVASPTSQMANSGPSSQSVAHPGPSVSSLGQSQVVAQADSPSSLVGLQQSQSGSSLPALQSPVSSSISSSVSISSSNPSVSSSIVQSGGNRSAWSVADTHSSQHSQASASIPSSSPKMIPLQTSA